MAVTDRAEVGVNFALAEVAEHSRVKADRKRGGGRNVQVPVT
jgi:hypothetical protein